MTNQVPVAPATAEVATPPDGIVISLMEATIRTEPKRESITLSDTSRGFHVRFNAGVHISNFFISVEVAEVKLSKATVGSTMWDIVNYCDALYCELYNRFLGPIMKVELDPKNPQDVHLARGTFTIMPLQRWSAEFDTIEKDLTITSFNFVRRAVSQPHF